MLPSAGKGVVIEKRGTRHPCEFLSEENPSNVRFESLKAKLGLAPLLFRNQLLIVLDVMELDILSSM